MDAPSADLRSLLDRLKGAQHALIDAAARQPGLPSTAIVRRIAGVAAAPDGATALAMIRAHEPDVAVLEIANRTVLATLMGTSPSLRAGY